MSVNRNLGAILLSCGFVVGCIKTSSSSNLNDTTASDAPSTAAPDTVAPSTAAPDTAAPSTVDPSTTSVPDGASTKSPEDRTQAMADKIVTNIISQYAKDLLRDQAEAGQKAMENAWSTAMSSGKMAAWEAYDPKTGFTLKGDVRPSQSGVHKTFKIPCTEFTERAQVSVNEGWRISHHIFCHQANGQYTPTAPEEVVFAAAAPSQFPIDKPSALVFSAAEVTTARGVIRAQTTPYAQQSALSKQIAVWQNTKNKLDITSTLLILTDFSGDTARLEALKSMKSLIVSASAAEERKIINLFIGAWFRTAAQAALGDR